MSSHSQRSVSPEGHGYVLEESTRHSFTPSSQGDHSRSLSPPPQSENPYRSSMISSIEESDARRQSTLGHLEKKATVTVQDAEIKSAMKTTSIKSKNENEKDAKRPKTTMFDVPEVVDEEVLQEKIVKVEKVMKQDIKIKFRIRMAKAFLRCINFGCSLIVVSMVANSFSIFFATRHLPARNNLPPWAPESILWPAYATLGISCLSLFTAIVVLFSYYRGGHRKAERAAIWFTALSVAGFFFMIILWSVTAAMITSARNNSGGKDLWAWSCNNNERSQLFSSTIDYDLVCRQMDWSFICSLIEIIVETFSILLYAAAFWRFAHKTKLRKSMEVRDKIRETIYMQKLEQGDMSVYRPEFDLAVDEEEGFNMNAIEQGRAGIVAEVKKQRQSFYPAVPVPSYFGAQPGAQPIIDPNSGLSVDPVTGEATKPTHY